MRKHYVIFSGGRRNIHTRPHVPRLGGGLIPAPLCPGSVAIRSLSSQAQCRDSGPGRPLRCHGPEGLQDEGQGRQGRAAEGRGEGQGGGPEQQQNKLFAECRGFVRAGAEPDPRCRAARVEGGAGGPC
eukprot:1808456-Pyramimonas_sp.AAC.1